MSSVPGVHLGSISEGIETGHRINACNRMWIAVRANTHRGILTTKIRVSRKSAKHACRLGTSGRVLDSIQHSIRDSEEREARVLPRKERTLA